MPSKKIKEVERLGVVPNVADHIQKFVRSTGIGLLDPRVCKIKNGTSEGPTAGVELVLSSLIQFGSVAVVSMADTKKSSDIFKTKFTEVLSAKKGVVNWLGAKGFLLANQPDDKDDVILSIASELASHDNSRNNVLGIAGFDFDATYDQINPIVNDGLRDYIRRGELGIILLGKGNKKHLPTTPGTTILNPDNASYNIVDGQHFGLLENGQITTLIAS